MKRGMVKAPLGGLAGVAGNSSAAAIGNDVGPFGQPVDAVLLGLQSVHHGEGFGIQPAQGIAAVITDQAAGLAIFGAGHGVFSDGLNDIGRNCRIRIKRPGHQLVCFVVVHLDPIALTPEIQRVPVGFFAVDDGVIVVEVSALESGTVFRVRDAGLDAVAFEVLCFATCFARCLSRLLILILNLLLGGHVFIRLSLCELASLSAFRRIARRWASQDSAEREKPEAARGTERSEYRTGEDFRAQPGPCSDGMAGLPFRAGER
jgi:hypothetical protein